MQNLPAFSRANPFYASIKERINLTLESAQKITQHIVLDIKDSKIAYNVGDSIGIFPSNAEGLVQSILKWTGLDGNQLVLNQKLEKTIPLKVYLKDFANITDLTKGLVETIYGKLKEGPQKKRLEELLKKESLDVLKSYLNETHLLDFLKDTALSIEKEFSATDLISHLKPLLPRFYSIASSSKIYPEEIHLTVVLLTYELRGDARRGVCTHFLSDVDLHAKNIPIFIQPSSGFTIPEKHDAPIIMVGPGTGVAPFRAFLQERMALNAKGKNWLFFGERNQKNSFFYKDFFLELQENGFLELDLAFSRDQPEKVYVQDRMREKGQDIYSWIESGGYFYVCGDAKKMARDVESALHEIIMQHGKITADEAKAYIKELRRQKRYLRDVY